MSLFKRSHLLFFAVLFFAACKNDTSNPPPENNSPPAVAEKAVPSLEYTVVSALPHDTAAFTEGLLFHNNQLFESTGSPSGSKFRSMFGIVDPKTGKIDVKGEIDQKYFGEGIVFFNNKIYQLTYQDQLGFIYDAATYKKTGQFNYANKEGWGMTTDGTHIIMSDGTEKLTYFDADFKPVKTLVVKDNGYAQESLNELEYIKGFIYANIWMTGNIVKIDPATGNVVARINMTPLSYEVKNFHPNTYEMNGIAYDAATDKIYVTGKAWPKIYEVKFEH